MLKEEELQIYDEAISKLGPDSYIGPWLQQVREEVEQAMRVDHPVDAPSLMETYRRAKDAIYEARLEAEAILTKAQEKAKIADHECRERRRSVGREVERLVARARQQINEDLGRIRT